MLKRLGGIMNRAVASVSYRFHVATANLWRDAYNPLRSLTIQRAVCLLEEGERGAFADLQWTYRFIEMQDAVLGALVERRTSAIQELDWSIKLKTEIPAGKEAVAKRQHDALNAAYGKIGNLTASFESMAMASFRGFARLEKVTDENGDVVELASVDQWFWVRQGLYGAWQLNRQSNIGTNRGEDVPEPRFICREVARPINRVALVAFVRKSLSQKDWDAFIEAFGIPAVFIVMPDSVPEGKEDEYMDLADQVSSDARGVLPNGSDVKTVDNGARGVNPFKDHIAYQDEMVVLRGTGGKLTMLAQSGSGTLAGNAHSETFQQIARAEAREISEIYRKSIDAEIIERVTPGEPAYAYFELAANEETDPAQVVRDVATLNRSGFQVDTKWVEEKTGYKLSQAPLPSTPAPATITNREQGQAATWKRFAPETGTLGIPRAIMPQIQSGNRAAMVNKLRSHGVDYTKAEIKPSDLKPTQAEYSPEKVIKAMEHEGPDRAILVSSDHHVVDGHHQYLARLRSAPNTPIPVFKIDAPIMHVLGIILQMASTTQDPASVRNRLSSGGDPFAALAGSLQDGKLSDAEFLAKAADAVAGLREVDPQAATDFWSGMMEAMEAEILSNLNTQTNQS
jgi:phage gp29-like protein